MRIVILSPFYYPVVGGVEKVVKVVAEYLAFNNNDVWVVTFNRLRKGGRGLLPSHEVLNAVNVVRISPILTWSHGSFNPKIGTLISTLKPDLVIVHSLNHPYVFQVAKLKKKLGFKAVLHTHGALFYDPSRLGVVASIYYTLSNKFGKKAINGYERVIGLTPEEKAILINRLGVDRDRAAYLPNGVDDGLKDVSIQATGLGRSENVVLYLGRISREKRVDLLVKAFKFLGTSENARLVLAGPDEGMVLKLMQYASRNNIVLSYAGTVSEAQKFDLLASCRIFVHPATTEGFSLTLLEAQILGKPCIVTGHGGHLYTAPPGLTSLYSDPDPKDMARKILTLLNDGALYDRLSRNAKNWAASHTWSSLLPRYMDVYRKICA